MELFTYIDISEVMYGYIVWILFWFDEWNTQ